MENTQGVYLLRSRFSEGSYIYKVGMSKNLSRRLKEYPPNFDEILIHPCENPSAFEKEILSFISENASELKKCDRGKEYFTSETDSTQLLMQIIINLATRGIRLIRDHSVIGNYNQYGVAMCSHHGYKIFKGNIRIGFLNLRCKRNHPDKDLMVEYLEFNDKPCNLHIRKIFNILEHKIFWNTKHYEVGERVWNSYGNILKEFGFYGGIKFNDINMLLPRSPKLIDNYYITKLVFKLSNSGDKAFDIDDGNVKIQNIMCNVRINGCYNIDTYKELISSEGGAEIYEFDIELSRPWIEEINIPHSKIDDCHLCVMYNDEYLLRPLRLKYYNDKSCNRIYGEDYYDMFVARIDRIEIGYDAGVFKMFDIKNVLNEKIFLKEVLKE